MPWIPRGSGRVDEETVVYFYECSVCGTEIDEESSMPPDREHNPEACRRARDLREVRRVMES